MKRHLLPLAGLALCASVPALAQPVHKGIDAANARISPAGIDRFDTEIDKKGYVVLSRLDHGTPSARPLGILPVPAGKSGDLRVKATKPLDSSATYALTLHYETNKNDSYDYRPGSKDADKPVMDGKRPVMAVVSNHG